MLCKPKDLSLDAQHPDKKLGTRHPSSRSQRLVETLATQANHIVQLNKEGGEKLLTGLMSA